MASIFTATAAALRKLLAASGGSLLLGWIHSGAGAVARYVQDKLRETIDAADYGVTANGVTDDTTALQAALVAGAGKVLRLPAGGNILVTAATALGAGNNVSIDGRGCTITCGAALSLNNTNVIFWNTAIGFFVKNLIVDFQSRTCVAGSEAVLGFMNCEDFHVEKNRVLNLTAVGITLNGCRNFFVRKNRLSKAVAANTLNKGILVTSAARQSYDGEVTGNTIDNTSIIATALRCKLNGNTIRNWKYGGGITTTADNANSGYYDICGNTIYGGTGTDVDATNCLGIESWGSLTTIERNTCYSNSGHGIYVGNQFHQVRGNICYNNGQTAGDGIRVGYLNATYNANSSVIEGNRCFDSQGVKTQNYGIYEESATLTGMSYAGNALLTNKTAPEFIQSTRVSSLGPVLNGTVAWTPGAIANGASASTTITVNGSVLGDMCLAAFDKDLQGCTIAGYALGGNTIVIVITNNTGGAKTIVAGNALVKVFKPINYASF